MVDQVRAERADDGDEGTLDGATMGELGAAFNTVVEESKFQLGRPPVRFDGLELPWAYGDNRITAMVRSPDSLYLYWEITDEGIAGARGRLGPAGADGWCNLRFYDTTGRDFDGINANDYFDIRIERTDREYFLQLHRSGASFHVEVGIKSYEGYFQPIARSGRADFPRKSPSPNHSLEWMTVTSEDHHPAARPYVSRYTGPPPWSGPPPARDTRPPPPHAIVGGHAGESRTFTWVHPAFTEVRWEGPWVFGEWKTEWRLRWIGERTGTSVLPIEKAQWVAGPFPIELLDPYRAGRLEIRLLGDDQVIFEEHMSGLEVFGPWEVRIQSFETGSERRQLGAWRVHWARVEPAKVERWWAAFERVRVNAWQRMRVVAGGASESLAVVEAGASERWRMGASERWSIGASEGFAMGASEVARASASEWLYGGASALLYGGASGMGWGGASERVWGGASEWLYGGESGGSPGASGWSPGGASEHVVGSLALGASEAYADWVAKTAKGGR
jgi:hypothetical protein